MLFTDRAAPANTGFRPTDKTIPLGVEIAFVHCLGGAAFIARHPGQLDDVVERDACVEGVASMKRLEFQPARIGILAADNEITVGFAEEDNIWTSEIHLADAHVALAPFRTGIPSQVIGNALVKNVIVAIAGAGIGTAVDVVCAIPQLFPFGIVIVALGMVKTAI